MVIPFVIWILAINFTTMNAFTKSSSWALILRGLLFVLFGLLTIFISSSTIYGPMFYLGILFSVTGGIYVVLAFMLRKTNSAWVWWLLWGLLDLCVGMYILVKTEQATDMLTIVVGVWAVIMALALVLAAFTVGSAYRIMLYSNALVSLVFGLLIIFNPFPAVMGLNLLIGLYTLLFGITVIYFGVKLRSVGGKKEEAKAKAV
jgi:uncharacterized membrane protein HdeD (DUF308 family)